jgi:hypothetical protein
MFSSAVTVAEIPKQFVSVLVLTTAGFHTVAAQEFASLTGVVTDKTGAQSVSRNFGLVSDLTALPSYPGPDPIFQLESPVGHSTRGFHDFP